MLAEIAIENLGVIPKATLELSEGLTVLTGETGAGKTMVVTGLRLLSGGRADASRVRTGMKQAVVDGRFQVESLGPEAARAIEERVEAAGGALDDDGSVLASRIVSAQGRSRAFLGGRAVPAAVLGEFAQDVLTIHGQNDQLRLLRADHQRDALDRFDPAIAALVSEHAERFGKWKRLHRELEEKTKSRREIAQDIDRLTFALKEIDDVDPAPGEDVALVAEVRRLQDVDALREAAATALRSIDGAAGFGEVGDGDSESEGASDLLGQAHAALVHVEDEQLGSCAVRLDSVTSQLAELSGELGRFLSELPVDADALEAKLQRQQELKQLTRKYAPDIDGVLAWRAKAAAKLTRLDVSDDALDALKRDAEEARKRAEASAAALSKARKAAAKQLAKLVTEELHGLAMPKAVLSVAVTQAPLSASGTDAVEFLLAASAGMQPRPLATAASGGELSRVMLALEVILSAETHGATLVFDEVDAGVGGRAAVEIGRRLARLATRHQVIVVTHLPQVAAYADEHLHVAKDVGDTAVTSGVERLSQQRRVDELARMLAGLDDTETGRAHASELLERAAAEVAAMRPA